MKKIVFVLALFANSFISIAQEIIEPVFDRSDIPEFHVEKVVITQDTTYIYCFYEAEADSWACISKDMYLEDINSGIKYPLLRAVGLPYAPLRRDFANDETIQVLLCFSHINTNRFNIIEKKYEQAFNIYGIDLQKTFDTLYSVDDIIPFYVKAEQKHEENDWLSAITYYHKQLEACNFVFGLQSYQSACAMSNLAFEYVVAKQYNKTILYGENAIDILNQLPKDSIFLKELGRVYGTVATAYQLSGMTEKGALFYELSLAIRKNQNGVGVLDYEEYLAYLAYTYYYTGNYPKALLYQKECVNTYEKKYKKDKRCKYDYINSLNNLCEFYYQMKKYEEAIKCGEQAVDLIEKDGCDNKLRIAVRLHLAHALSATDDKKKAIEQCNIMMSDSAILNKMDFWEVVETRISNIAILLDSDNDTLHATNEYKSILKQCEDSLLIGIINYPAYSNILSRLYFITKKTSPIEGMGYLEKIIETQRKWNGHESMAYANWLLEYIRNIWIDSLVEKKGEDTLITCLRESFNIVKRHINNSSYNMSKDDRLSYWLRYKDFFTRLIPIVCGLIGTDDATSLAYDASLFYKGMLLSTEKGLKDVILSSNDSALINLYEEYSRNINLLEKEYEKNSSAMMIDSLKSVISDEEYLLSQKVTKVDKHIKGTNFTWKEIKDKLKEGDTAIEIISYRSLDGSSVYYDAYVVDCKSVAPKLIFLFEENELKSCISSDSINYDKLALLIWGNKELIDELTNSGTRNIYISPSGLLNTIGFDYLPIGEGKYISDVLNIYRLSSTRGLCYENLNRKTETACLFGGLDYNFIPHSVPNDEVQPDRITRALANSLVKRGSFDPLYGSGKEVEQVRSELTNNEISCRVYSGLEGTEEAFKTLSGSHLNIIHLSTHGMYITSEEDKDNRQLNLPFIFSDEVKSIDNETKSLSRSFLVMSGGNMLIHKDSIPSGMDDGILTSLEISHLDFNDLDLVVLSACQTALGTIESEGVYGLQRAFKKAGANTILMSLDKVDDEATRILMVEFYKNLISGKSKLQSLKDAQQYLREYDNGKYDDPKYWASFIMLDGLN